MTPEQLPTIPSTPENGEAAKPAKSLRGIGVLPSLGLLLLELLLPVTLAGAVLYWLSGTVRLWSLNHVLALVIFGIILLAFSLILSVLLDRLTLPFRKRNIIKKVVNPVGPRFRWVKYILAGLLIPGGVFAAANLVVLPRGGTSMAIVEKQSQLLVKASHAAVIGDAVLSSTSVMTKIQGIKALQAVPSPDSLDQLFRILTTDPASLGDAGVYKSLSDSIASYGTASKEGLFDIYKNNDPIKYKINGNPSQDTFSWYFSASFDELRIEIQAQNPDQTSQQAELARLDSIQTNLQQALTAVHEDLPAPSAFSPLPDFVLHTFLTMDVKEDKEILQFAKDIAPDSAISDGARGQALLLIAKLGGKDELDDLYSYLASNDEFIKAKALEAIISLQSNSHVSDSLK